MMDNLTEKRLHNVLGALVRAQNPEFRKVWQKIFDDLFEQANAR